MPPRARARSRPKRTRSASCSSGSRTLEEGARDSARPDDPTLDQDLEAALAKVPVSIARTLGWRRRERRARPVPRLRGPGRRGATTFPARLVPRRLKTTEGWDVMIGRSNEGNDYLTHQLARSEDYWFHVHGAAGSHVVLRRGKGKNEPSRQHDRGSRPGGRRSTRRPAPRARCR